MKQILIISGKGGTGKTILTASFAAISKNKVMVDCDVDAADLHLILHPNIKERYDFKSGKTAVVNPIFCNKCGKCQEVCRFDAISDAFLIDSISCEGCGLCAQVCQSNAIIMKENLSGEWYVSDTEYGPLVHAKLGIAEENSGKLVAKVRQVAKELAQKENSDYVIIDGPPGIGCPVIASLSGIDMAVIITEPTLSGLHDLKRAIEIALHFKILIGIVINKYDLNVDNTNKIEEFCKKTKIDIIGKIPFSKEVSKSIVNGIPAVLFCKNNIAENIRNIWEKIK
ncbi:MAG: (4Fe-4S)-binding protein [Elusimicrobia bacterium RIFOXYD2_FULL_34_15]|nr:MAG: (4Fe-4S)-binding protein [Elusimicrobia bacterium RIFOXYD2_FULL_34_15]HAM38290.1 (4Fe-4S)-binding protein [Elusimicrobiota bacterium]